MNKESFDKIEKNKKELEIIFNNMHRELQRYHNKLVEKCFELGEKISTEEQEEKMRKLE